MTTSVCAVTPTYATHRKFFCPAPPRFDSTWHRLSDSGATRRYMAGDGSKLKISYHTLKGDEPCTATAAVPVQQGTIVLLHQDPEDGAWVLDVPRSDGLVDVVMDCD